MSSTLNGTTVSTKINTGEAVTQNTVVTQANYSINSASSNAPLAAGTGAGKAQHTWTNTITVNTTGTTLDLTALTGGLDGGTRNFANIKDWYIENLDATNSINVGNAASNGWTGINGSPTTLTAIGPGGHRHAYEPTAAGLAVGGSNKLLLIAAAAATVSVIINFVGEGT